MNWKSVCTVICALNIVMAILNRDLTATVAWFVATLGWLSAYLIEKGGRVA